MATLKTRQPKKTKLSIGYRQSALNGWQYSNKSALDIINEYQKKIQNGDWLSSEDRTTYKNAIDTYTSTGNKLREASKHYGQKYTADEEKSWTDSLSSLQTGYNSANDFYNQFADDIEYGKWYDYNTKLTNYNNLTGASDYAENSKYISGVADNRYNFINQSKGWGFANPFSYAANGNDTGKAQLTDFLAFPEAIASWNKGDAEMTDEQIGIYNYLYASEGKEKADEYLDFIADTVMQQKVDASYKNFKLADTLFDITTHTNNLGEYIYGFGSGVDTGLSGFYNAGALVEGKKGFTPASQYVSSQIRQELGGKNGELTLEQVFYDLANTTGNMAPSIGIGALTTPLGGAVAMGLSSAGNNYASMIDQGYDVNTARAYGIMTGVAEAGMSYAFSGIGKLGGKLTGKAISKFTSGINNAILRIAGNVVGNVASEALEEATQTILDPVFKWAATLGDEEMEAIDWGEVGYSALLGGLSAGLLEGGPSIVKTGLQSHQAYTNAGGATLGGTIKAAIDPNINFSDYVSQGAKNVTNTAGAYANAVAEVDPNNKAAKYVQERINKGKSVSGYQVNRLATELDTAITNHDRGAIKSAVETRLNDLGEKENVSKLADVLTKQAMGEKLSLNDKSILKKSTYGEWVSSELDPESVNRGFDGEYSDFAESIGTKRVNADVYNLREGSNTKSQNVTGETTPHPSSNDATFPSEQRGRQDVLAESAKLIEQAANDKVGKIEGFTEETANVMVSDYDGSVSPSEYVTAFDQAFKLGRDNAQIKELTRLSTDSGVTGRALLHAYDAGLQSRNVASKATNPENTVLQNGSESAIINTESEIINNEGKTGTEGIRLRNGGEWFGGKNTEGQIRRMEGGAGQNQEWREGRGRPADGEATRLLDEGRGREVRVADLGILNGSKQQKVRVIENEADFTPSMKEAAKKAKEQGLIAKFIVGDNLLMEAKDGSLYEANGYILGNIVLIRADHADFTSDQLMTHEVTHDKLAKVGAERKHQIIVEARKKITAVADTPEAVNQLSASYADAYRGSQLTEDEIWEEIICDIEAGMNRFGGNRKYLMDYAIRDTKGYAGQMISESAVQNNGGVTDGRASRNFSTKGKVAKYLPDSKVGKDNREYLYRQLLRIYSGINDGIADGIAIANGKTVFIVDSGKDNGKLDFGVRRMRKVSADIGREKFIRSENDKARSNGNISDELLERLGYGRSSDSGRNMRRESGSELQADTGKSDNQQGRVSGEDADQRGITEFKSAEEAKDSGRVSDARFSIEFADDIADKQRKYEADGLSRISSAELEKAIADTARMVEEMKPYANILPQDKVGKTLVKNGSYDVSVENTTVCIRTLAYNSFVDMVSEKVGRPLTQMESFLVSQKLYEIAKEPQCLYCYVSLDRKAFNEMVIRYTEQRDEAIKAYEAAGKPKVPSSFNAEWGLFEEFLDGRKPTKNMWDRYVGWLNAYNKGERLVSLADISTEAKRLKLVEAGGEMALQVKDMLKYAQSASWAKKQTQYVAYYDEILKLKPAVIRNLNSHYGMRWYSFSDYSGAFIVENMQQITDAAIRGLKGLSYTKDTDFAEIFAPTGMNINISVYAKKGENGYEIDAKQSANIDEAIRLRNEYPNVGIVVVATDAKGVEWALEQEWSDVVIPFHTVRTGADVAEFYNWEIFNAEQSDTIADQNLWDAYVNSVGKKKASKMVYPSEHQNNKDSYLRIIEERGLKPRFSSFLNNSNYMKLVNETRQSEGQTQPLKPNYNLDAALRSFDKFVEKGGYYEGWYNDGIDVDNEAEIVASDVRAGKKANEVDYGRQDVDFEAVKAGRKDNRVHGRASIEFDSEIYETVSETDEDVKTRNFLENARTNRGLLANALETVAQNDAEREKLKQYKDRVDMLNRESLKLSKINEEIKELTFGKGNKNPARLKELKEEAIKTSNRINLHDKKLLSLEATKSLKDVLDREKKKAYKAAAEKGREALHRNVEGRHKTAERHAIRKVVNDLEKLLNRGTKDRNVKEGERGLVEKLLDITDRLFATDDELILDGIVTTTTQAEKNAIADYIALYEEYHSYDDNISSNKELRADLRTQMNEVKKSLEGVLERERQRINEARATDAFDALIAEYKKLKSSEYDYISKAYDSDIAEHLESLKENLGDTTIAEMTLTQLENLHKAVTMVKTTIQNSNRLFKENGKSVETLGKEAQAEIEKQGHKDKFTEIGKSVSKISWNNLKPIYLLERTGSKVLQKLGQAIMDGESKWARIMRDARDFAKKIKLKHGYKRWNIDKTHQFTNEFGQTFKITTGQIMSIYAYSKRGEQALNHLRTDGFVMDKLKVVERNKMGIPTKYELNDKTAYKVSDKTLMEMLSKLTPEQKAYVDEMQKYLSEDMGKLGNEISMQLYGINMFGEEYYFPIHSSGSYLERVRQQQKGETKIKNKGFTKPTVKMASNAIVLTPFNEVWSDHVSEMASYNAFTLALEDFYKVYNYQTKSSAEDVKKGVIPALENAFGEASINAIDQLLKDLNGGARTDAVEFEFKKLLTKFKRAKTLLSLSVVVQQPSAVLRAQAIISPKYFVGKKIGEAKSKALWEEIKQYAPVATIKEMGHFDVGMGRSSASWLMAEEYDGFAENVKGFITDEDFRGEVLGYLPAKADEMAWVAIWNAVKLETASKNPKLNTSSKEFLEMAGKRFEDVIRRTQVYDSTLAKSANMRSKSTLMQMEMAFMAEPTTSINMLEMALRSGDLKTAARTAGAVYASYLFNAILVALPYAMRDDDEDETFAEKYISALTSSFLNNANPLTSLPILKDVWSVFQGYSIERTDMSLIEDLATAGRKVFMGAIDGEFNADSIVELAGHLSAFTGIPIANVIRDIKSIINAGKTITKEIDGMATTWNSVLDELQETGHGETPILSLMPKENKGKKLYDAIIDGDEKYVARFKSEYEEKYAGIIDPEDREKKITSAYESAVRKALRDNDPRLREAALAWISGDEDKYWDLLIDVVEEGIFDEKIITDAFKAEREYHDNKKKEAEAEGKTYP